ncbi:MAG: DNA repair protein RadC [Candidatus Hydrogenedentota bacterium]
MTQKLYSTAVREMPEEERPRERLARLGAIALRDAELLAVLFRTGTREEGAIALAERLLRHFGNLRVLSRASIEELMQVKGVGRVKAIEIKAAVELGVRLANEKDEQRPKIRSAEDVANLLMARFKQCETEEFKALLLNTKNEVLKEVKVASGGLDAALAMPRDVFRQAVREAASAVIVCHNHPSGDPQPSPEDIRITERLRDAAEILGLRFLDHIVFGSNRWVSLQERGLL